MNKINPNESANKIQSDTNKDIGKIIYENSYAKRIILALRKIMQQMDLHSRSLNKHYGLTIPQLVCLYNIYEKGVLTLSVPAKNVHLSRSTLVGIIDRLEEKGFVKRTRDIEDRRAIFIDITEKGRSFVQSTPHLLHNRLHDDLLVISEGEQIIIANSLDLLVGMLNKSAIDIEK